MTQCARVRALESAGIDRLIATRVRAAARLSVPSDTAPAIDEIITEAFVSCWPQVRRACLAGRPLDQAIRAELQSVARRLIELGLPRARMIDVTRTLVAVIEKQVASVEHSLDAVRALRISKYALMAVHDLTAALLGTGVAAGRAVDPADPPDGEDDVSWLEREILRRLAYGQSSSQIAGELHYSKQAVSYHLSRLLNKYRVPNRTALVAMAYESGLLPVRVDSGLYAS
jgi:DNA-binding CsgD family transcriptional regulator